MQSTTPTLERPDPKGSTVSAQKKKSNEDKFLYQLNVRIRKPVFEALEKLLEYHKDTRSQAALVSDLILVEARRLKLID